MSPEGQFLMTLWKAGIDPFLSTRAVTAESLEVGDRVFRAFVVADHFTWGPHASQTRRNIAYLRLLNAKWNAGML